MQKPNKAPKKSSLIMYLVLFCIIIGSILLFFRTSNTRTVLSYNDFKNYSTNLSNSGKINSITICPAGGDNYTMYRVYGTYTDKTGTDGLYQLYLSDSELTNILHEENFDSSNITVNYAILSSTNWLLIILNILPLILLVAFFYFSMKSSSNKQAFDFGKNRARLSRDKTITFKDVAGCDEEKQELEEIIDFLKNPIKYAELGARIPKGVLLVGPPGTGKTLLAKAVAGEANVPFFSISGSDFVEMFVGVGASRVRDLFKVAKENHPCIIFIDEIDAVGRQRGAGFGGGHDEREQTLNQLLVEMDGFSNNSGIIIMAATNRPDVLDPALLRPGRFDRQITISAPDVIGREAILKVHARNKKFAPSVKFNEVAQRIPGFSGAEIENLLNEAALLAARQNRKIIEISDIDEAVDRVLMGPAKKSRKYSEHERKVIAYHEAGHAVIGLRLDNANIVQKVTIVPRGQAGGYNLMLPVEETFLHTKQSLIDQITGYLGGRVAEETIFNEMTTGAHNDIERATKIARAMVTEYGMSSLGPVQLEHKAGSVFLGRDYMNEKNFSDQVAAEIDAEVRKIINSCYKIAVEVINTNINDLHNISKYLLAIETLTKSDIEEIASTGKLKWWDEKVLRDSQENNDENNDTDTKLSDTPLLDDLEKNDETR